ncbi:hypothetical protein BJY01DRAFT_259068 [Aspergillus pseudoustus]|uniref:BHLH domain-containing protein n=1 Tax=Aspergillus pseudoustus TaxID=1810923 RepID=A0ABR4L0F3_9EURO
MDYNRRPDPHQGTGDPPPASQQTEGPFGFQFFNPQTHDSDTQILQPEPRRPRRNPFNPSDPSSIDFTYVSTPESAVPSHQILPSQRDTHTPGVTSPSPTAHDLQSSSLSLSWGSDPSFGPEGYSPHPDTPTHDAMENNLTELYMSWVDFSVEEPEDTNDADRTLPEVENVGGRRRSFREGGGDGARPSSRRRLQHILSERNRRTQQSKLYDEICALVPGVSPKRRRKSEVLMRAAEWLEDLTEGNRKLMEQLEHLKEDDDE